MYVFGSTFTTVACAVIRVAISFGSAKRNTRVIALSFLRWISRATAPAVLRMRRVARLIGRRLPLAFSQITVGPASFKVSKRISSIGSP